MKIKDMTVKPSTTKAIIKVGLLKWEQIEIPTKKLMLAFTNPEKWNEVTEQVMNENFDDFGELLTSMYKRDNRTLAEIMLKIAGKHHNPYENQVFQQLFNNY